MKLASGIPLVGVAAVGLGGVLLLPTEKVISSFRTRLKGRTHAQRHNATLAAIRLNGAVIKPGGEFSFNRRVGTFSRDAGFQKAPVSYNGDLIKDWGGGVCQTSTTLYNAALLAGFPIVERFHHRFAPSYIGAGRDAAVAFPGVDLRFRNNLSESVRVIARVEADNLIVEFASTQMPKERSEVVTQVHSVRHPVLIHLPLGSESRGVRSSGHDGFEVTIFRQTGKKREKISEDSYPSMDRVIGVSN